MAAMKSKCFEVFILRLNDYDWNKDYYETKVKNGNGVEALRTYWHCSVKTTKFTNRSWNIAKNLIIVLDENITKFVLSIGHLKKN